MFIASALASHTRNALQVSRLTRDVAVGSLTSQELRNLKESSLAPLQAMLAGLKADAMHLRLRARCVEF